MASDDLVRRLRLWDEEEVREGADRIEQLERELSEARADTERLNKLLDAWSAEANCWPLKGEDFDRRRMLVERSDAAREEPK